MGVATHSGAVLRGSLEEVMKVLQGWKRLEVASQRLDAGLRFGMQIPPPQEMLTEPLLVAACLVWGRGSVPLCVVCRQRRWKEGTAPQPPAVG